MRLGAPIIDEDGNIYVTTWGANGGEYISSYNSSGTRRWFYQIADSTFTGEAAIKGNTVYIVESSHLRAINAETGTLVWQWTSPESGNLTSPVVDSRGVIYTASGSNIYAITQIGTTKLTYAITPGLSSPIIPENGLIYLYRNQPGTSNGWLYALGQAHETSYPVIFIPGIGGSEFKATQDIIWSKEDGHGGTYSHAYPSGEKIWVNESEAAALGDDDYFDVLRLKTDGETPEADLTLTGNLTPLGYPDIDTFFTGMGYEKDTNFFVFPYDWRKDVRTTKDSLDALIDEAKSRSGMPKVNIVAHSMGGLVARYYIADSDKAAKVGKLISLGVPHLGAVDSLKALMYGTWFAKDFYLFKLGLPPSETYDISQNLPSTFQLLPSKTYFDFYNNSNQNYPFPFKDDRDIDNNQVTGTLNFSQTKTLLSNLNHNMTVFNFGEQFHEVTDPSLSNPNGVKIYGIVGSGKDTIGQIRETWLMQWPTNLIPIQDEIKIDGDGTVPTYSASLKSNSLDISGSVKIYYVKQKHDELVSSDGPAMQTVNAILNEGDIFPIQIKDEKISLSGQQLSVYLADVDLYDDAGNHTGLDNNGEIETNIPNTSYSKVGQTTHVFLDKSASRVTAKIKSASTTKARIKIRNYTEDTINKAILYNNVPVSSSSIIEFTIDPDSASAPTMSDGTQTFTATAEVTGDAAADQAAPSTSVQISGTQSSSGVYTGPVTVTLTGNDTGAGILRMEYSLDNGQTAQTYNGPFTISTSGVTAIKVRSIDRLGNEEYPQTITFTILAPAPTPTQSPTTSINFESPSSATSSTPDPNHPVPIASLLPLPSVMKIIGEASSQGEILGVNLSEPAYETGPNKITAEVSAPFHLRVPWFVALPALIIALTPLFAEAGSIFLKRSPFKHQISKKMDNPKPKKNVNSVK